MSGESVENLMKMEFCRDFVRRVKSGECGKPQWYRGVPYWGDGTGKFTDAELFRFHYCHCEGDWRLTIAWRQCRKFFRWLFWGYRG